MEQVLLKDISGHVKEKEVIGNSQRGFSREYSCLTNLIDFYVKITSLVDQGRAMYVIYLDFSEAFNSASYNILVAKLGHYSVDGWTTSCLKSSWMVGLKGP